ncbi:unnamed protein product [Discosporangium mesarthrocarpum]
MSLSTPVESIPIVVLYRAVSGSVALTPVTLDAMGRPGHENSPPPPPIKLGLAFPGRYISAPVVLSSTVSQEVVLEGLDSSDPRVVAVVTRSNVPAGTPEQSGGGDVFAEREVGWVEFDPSHGCSNAWECVVDAVVSSGHGEVEGEGDREEGGIEEGGVWDLRSSLPRCEFIHGW